MFNPFDTLDVAKAVREIQTNQAEFIKTDGAVRLQCVFVLGAEPVLRVTAPPHKDDVERDLMLIRMLLLYPSLDASAAFIVLGNSLKYDEGVSDSVVIVKLHHGGAEFECYPYRQVEGEVQFRANADVDTSFGAPIPQTVSHMLPTFVHTHERLADASEVCRFVESAGFELEFLGGRNLSNIDSRGRILIEATQTISESGTDITAEG